MTSQQRAIWFSVSCLLVSTALWIGTYMRIQNAMSESNKRLVTAQQEAKHWHDAADVCKAGR